MNKPLNEDAITRAVLKSVELAEKGTPEQRAGMFRPRPADQPKRQAKRTASR